MAKRLWNIAIVAMIAMCMGLMSCSSDNDKKDEPMGGGDDNSIESLLIGKWKTIYNDGGYYLMDFRSNGMCYCEEGDGNGDRDTWISYYIVSGSKVTLIEKDDPEDIETFGIMDVTKTRLIIYWDWDETDIEVYTRVK